MMDTLKQAKMLKLRDLPSGQTLRNFRKRLALSGKRFNRDEAQILTTKFKLELPPSMLSQMPSFKSIADAYNVIEQGPVKGSLAHFLFVTLVSGFRIFPTATEAETFANRQAWDESAFEAALTQTVGAKLPKFTLEALVKRLRKGVRARGGKDARFVEDVLIAEYRKELCKTAPKGADEATLEKIFMAIATKLCARFSSWQELTQNPSDALSAVDAALTEFGDFPSLREMGEKANVAIPKYATIVYDPNLPVLSTEANQGALPYAVVSTILSYPEKPEDADAAKFVQAHLTTSTASGLSWFFNAGLKLFQEQSVETLCALWSVPPEKSEGVRQIKEASLAVPSKALDLFGNKSGVNGWHDFRTSFQGRIDSWVSNYNNRLDEFQGLLESFGGTLTLPNTIQEGEDFLKVADCDRGEVEALIRAFVASREGAMTALSNLKGADPTNARQAVAVIENYAAVCTRLVAIREKLTNVLGQHKKDPESPWCALAGKIESQLTDWNRLKAIPKINAMNGGIQDPAVELNTLLEHFACVRRAMQEHLTAIHEWVRREGVETKVVESAAALQVSRAGARVSSTAATEYAVRQMLQRIAYLVRDRKDPVAQAVLRWFVKEGIFARTKDFNKFFYNGQGTIYKSPFSTKKHAPYDLGAGVVARGQELWSSFNRLIEEQQCACADIGPALETWLRLHQFAETMFLRSVDLSVPREVAALRLDEASVGDVLSDDLKTLLQSDAVRPSVVCSVINCYVSLLFGDLIRLRRQAFYLRAKFTWVGNTAICYAPKDKAWKMPERYRNSQAWKPVFDNRLLCFNDDGTVNCQKTFEAVMSVYDPKKGYLQELLHQLPHNWYYLMPFAQTGSGAPVKVLVFDKKGRSEMSQSVRKTSLEVLARLVGPSVQKGRLDALLLKPGTSVGDMTLLVDQRMTQRLDKDRVSLEEAERIYSLAMPISEMLGSASTTQQKPFSRIVAIDQGEMGLGYAVFDLDDAGNGMAEPIALGMVRIPSIRRLINSVRQYRHKGQKIQKFNQNYDSNMFTMRENVAGDVCGTIAGLMSRYHALPVLESSVSNLASGSKQLALVYKMVNAKFLHDSVQMHNTERAAWWYGVTQWPIEGFFEEVSSEYFDKYAKKQKDLRKIGERFYRPLVVNPGMGVFAGGTSRQCSHCGNNIFELIKAANGDGVRKVTLDGNGEAELRGKRFQLFARPTMEEGKKARRRNERAFWERPLANKELSMNELEKRAKENLRRAPKSLQSKDTTQSRYYCVFKECTFHNREQHADVNAAINIGRRFLKMIIKFD